MNEVRIYGRFEDLRPAHEKIFADASRIDGIFSSLSWFRLLYTNTFAERVHLRIFSVESGADERTSHCVLPMCHQIAAKRWFSPRKLTALTNYYSSLFSPILSSEFSPFSSASDLDAQENLNILAQAIAADSPSWDMIDMHPMAIDAPLFDAARLAFGQAGMATQSYFCFGNWYLDVNGRTYQEYFDNLPSKLRNTLKRKTRQLEGRHRLRIEIISELADVAKGVTAYEKIYRASWKNPESYSTFMPEFIQMCAENGCLRMGVAYIDEQPAAAQLWIVSNKKADIYKLAYDEQFATLSIGSILTAHMMQYAIDVDRVEVVDYLTGDDTYKQDWMSHRRERWGIVAFNLRTLRGIIAAGKHIGGRRLKDVLNPRRLIPHQVKPR